MIPFFKQIFTEEMKQAALNALENERFVLGESVFKFEEEFAKYCGSKYACSVNSGTSALKIACQALGVGRERNEKVITTPMSFIATANSIIFAGGTPSFSDIDYKTGLLDANALQELKKEKEDSVKGIMPVHLYGQPCEMDAIKDYAEENGLFIVEDACQAHGALYKEKKAGSLGDVGCFSFYAAKNMTVGGDGGMIVTDNEEVFEKAKILRDCGRLTKYEHSMIGSTNRLNTANAAIGLVQLKYLDEWTEARRTIAEIYRKNLPEELLLGKTEGSESAYHLFVIKANGNSLKEKIELALKENEIQYGVHYPIPIHLQPIYKERFGHNGGEFPNSEKFSHKILSLPIHPSLSKDDVLFVCEKINGVFE